MVKFALASMKYHRRTTIIYISLLFISFCLLLFVNSLRESLPFIEKHIEELLAISSYQEEKQALLRQIQASSRMLQQHYDRIYFILLPLLAGGLLLFFALLQVKKRNELFAWHQSGSSLVSWVRLNLTECLLPLLLLCLVFILLVLLLQNLLGNLILNIHIKAFDHFHSDNLATQSLTLPLNRLLVRLPTNNYALAAAAQLTSREWLRILFTALRQTAYTFFLLISLSGFIIFSNFSYWGYRHWNNSST